MQGKELKAHAKHFQERIFDRNAPTEKVKFINPDVWELVTVVVRKDTGKFVSSAWRVPIDQRTWWVVVGLHDTIETIIDADERKRGHGEIIVESGELYNFVDEVNIRLMKDAKQSDLVERKE